MEKVEKKEKPKMKKGSKYFVSKRCAITCLKGMICEGEEIKSNWISGGMPALKKLVELKKVEMK